MKTLTLFSTGFGSFPQVFHRLDDRCRWLRWIERGGMVLDARWEGSLGNGGAGKKGEVMGVGWFFAGFLSEVGSGSDHGGVVAGQRYVRKENLEVF